MCHGELPSGWVPAEQACWEKLLHRLRASSVSTEPFLHLCSLPTAVSLGCSSSSGSTNLKRQRTPKANALEWHQLKVNFCFPVELTNRPWLPQNAWSILLETFSTCFFFSSASLPLLKRLKATWKCFSCSISVGSVWRGVQEDQQQLSQKALHGCLFTGIRRNGRAGGLRSWCAHIQTWEAAYHEVLSEVTAAKGSAFPPDPRGSFASSHEAAANEGL